MESKKPYIGGQAVIEGVMMRSPHALAVAVRRPDGSIAVREARWISLFDRAPWLRVPPIRGGIVFLESMFNGFSALRFSAEQALPSAQVGEADPMPAGAGGRARAPAPRGLSKGLSPRAEYAAIVLTMFGSLGIGLALFVALPHFLAALALSGGESTGNMRSFAFHALDGAIKIAFFVGYVALVRRLPEIKRIFGYHGAEHKSINAYERDDELTVQNAKRGTTFHPRCGTSFVLTVLIISIFFFAAVLPSFPGVGDIEGPLAHVLLVGIKIPLMLPIAGLAYELIRLENRFPGFAPLRLLGWPGRWMQQLTTAEPSDDQIEIALAAMRAALAAERSFVGEPVPESPLVERATRGEVLVFRDFGEVQLALPASKL